MFDTHNRRGVAKSLLAVCLVLGVATAGMGAWVLHQSSGLIGPMAAGGPQETIVSGSLSVPTGSGNGTLTVAVKDRVGTPPVTSITFGDLDLGPTSFPNTPQLVLTTQGQPVSEANPLQPGATACGSVEVQNVTAGDTYSINVDLAFGNGGQRVQELSLTAQLGGGGCSSYTETASQESSCNAATPLSLQQIGPVSSMNFGNSSNEDSIVVVWWNCSNRTLQFAMTASPLNVTVESNGKLERVTAALGVSFQNSTRTVGGGAGVGFELPITFNPFLVAGATILQVNGTLIAVSPTTGSPLSADVPFEAS